MVTKNLSLCVLFPEDEAQLGLRKVLRFRTITMLTLEEGANDVICQFGNLDRYKERTIVPHAFSPELTLFAEGHFQEPATFVYADQLRNMGVDYNPRHKAIKAYIDCLPPKTRIVLCWHR